MIAGLESREFWLLLGMMIVAAFFAFINYGLTKVGNGNPFSWKSAAWKIVYGLGAGFIVWVSVECMEGLSIMTIPHGVAMALAIPAGFFAEKTIAVYVARKERALLGQPQIPASIALRKEEKKKKKATVGPVVPEKWADLKAPPSKKT